MRSLTSRFIATLVVSVLVTSLATTWLSIQATESFLRQKIDQKFVTTLTETRQRLVLWHLERELEIETLARSATLTRSLTDAPAALKPVASSGLSRSARSSDSPDSAADRYLSLVLEQLPQLDALFVLNPAGELHAWVGTNRSLSESLRQALANTHAPSVGELLEDEVGRLHISSAPIVGKRDKTLGSVHAVIKPDALDALLASESLGSYGHILVVGSESQILAPRSVLPSRPHYQGSLLQTGKASAVERYQVDGATTVIGGALAFPRHGWTLVVEEPYADAFAPVVAISRRTTAISLAIVGLFSSLALLLARSIVRPIRALSLAAAAIAEGDQDVVIPVSSQTDEVGVLTRALHKMTARLWRNQQELENQNEALELLAITDGLTELYNHRYFHTQLARETKRASRSGEAISLILLDIDDFKQLNDLHGHAAGDRALKAVAAAMRDSTRKSDLLARYGGEEFALLSFGNPLEGTVGLAEKLRIAVSETKIPAPAGSELEWIQVTVSAGVAEYRGDPEFFERADRALYLAKDRGKDCVVADEEESQPDD